MIEKKLLVAGTFIFMTGAVSAQEILGGIPGLACQAILCLSSGTRPGECSPSLDHYFGIKHKYWSDTVAARFNFLNQCPRIGGDSHQKMQELISAISRGAGRCDAEYLNRFNVKVVERTVCRDNDYCETRSQVIILDTKPDYCTAYDTHSYTYNLETRYIGTPLTGGQWADPDDYEEKLAAYNKRMADLEAAKLFNPHFVSP